MSRPPVTPAPAGPGDRVQASDLHPYDLFDLDGRRLILSSAVPDPHRPGHLRLSVLDPDWTEQPPLTLPADTVLTLAGERVW